jgi:phage terminase small subunit
VLAGYKQSNARQHASRLLKKADIKALIADRSRQLEASSILTAEQRDEILSRIALEGEHRDSIKAISELNKCSGRHLLKHEHSGPNGRPIQVVTRVTQPEAR